MFLDNQKHQPAVKVSEKSQSERGNFGHLCVAIETDAVFLSLFKSDFIKKWMDERWKDVLGGFQRAKTKSTFSYLCSYDGCGGPRCAAVAHRVILSRVSASFSACYVPVGTFNTANSLASARYLNSSAVLVTATVMLMEDGLRYRWWSDALTAMRCKKIQVRVMSGFCFLPLQLIRWTHGHQLQQAKSFIAVCERGSPAGVILHSFFFMLEVGNKLPDVCVP